MLKQQMHNLKWKNGFFLGKVLMGALRLSSPQGLFPKNMNEGKQ